MLENVISVYVWKDRVRITNLYHTREFIYQFTQAELPFCRWRLDGYLKNKNKTSKSINKEDVEVDVEK